VVVATVLIFNESVAGRPVGSAAADGRQPLSRTRVYLSLHLANTLLLLGALALCAHSSPAAKSSVGKACDFRNCQA